MYTNIRGIKGKKSSLIEHLGSEEPQIFLLTETLLPTNTDIKLDNYTFFGKARSEKQGGGVGILVRNNIRNLIIPHISEREIEMLWISLRRKNHPLFIGCYYGKQESRCSVEEIKKEMEVLSEEIEEYKKEGEIIIFMDGNGKIGLLGEEKSRNGKLLEKVFEEHELTILNKSDKCKGKVTRENTKNMNEKSAIDFVVSTKEISRSLISMEIDEEGIYKIRGNKNTDHNTIIINIEINKIDKPRAIKHITWRLNAPESSWTKFNTELGELEKTIVNLFKTPNKSINELYSKWLQLVEHAARRTIGKSTFKESRAERFSSVVTELRKRKRDIKNELKKKPSERTNRVNECKEIQEILRQQIQSERAEKIEKRASKILKDNSRTSFWRERKKINKDHTLENLTIKNNEGKRQYDPEKINETMADYYENLYRRKPIRWHKNHDEIEYKVKDHTENREYEEQWYNSPPTPAEILEIIENKKNGKATTELKNEIMKNAKVNFTRILMPLINYIWENEVIPSQWNAGLITSIWKGRGDKESLDNHRGITVSSTIGNILEEAIDKRADKIVKFSPGQAGGMKGASTYDHLFLLRALMTIATNKNQNLFLTFFDVSKAYDNADVNNMLHVMWNAGIKGKLWRLLQAISNNQTAQIKTRHGLSKIIKRETGGKQGSRLTGKMFSKQMDGLSEEFIMEDEGNVHVNENLSIGCLEWVDDVLSCTIGIKNQRKVLLKVDEFAMINKLEWGEAKCQVMQIGRKTKVPDTWKFGDKHIKNTSSYKYLGDNITNDNKNKTNIEKRSNIIQGIIRQINTTASSETMRVVETKTILDLYDKCVIPSLLNNSESWTLSKTEETELDKIGIRAIKRLFSLPEKTPSIAVIYSFGLLYTSQLIDKKRFIYLHKILTRSNEHWTKQMLFHLKTEKLGWAANIAEKLTEYSLEEDWEKIREKTKREWKYIVGKAVNKLNKNKMINECTEATEQGIKIKTKTFHIHTKLTDTSSETANKPLKEIITTNKLQARTIIIARNGMLECGKNFKGTLNETCLTCNKTDNEQHRLTECAKWTNESNQETAEGIVFNDIYSQDDQTLKRIIIQIQNLWELRYGNGKMKK